MSRLMIYILEGLLISGVILYCCSKILDKKNYFKEKKFWIAFFTIAIYMILSYQVTDNFIRVIFLYALLSIMTIFVFHINVMQSVLNGFMAMSLLILSEIIYMVLISYVGISNNIEFIKNNYFGDLFSNIAIAFIMFLLINIKWLQNFFQKVIKNIQFRGSKTILIYSVFSLTALTILLYYIYFEIDLFYASLLCIFLIITFALLTLYLFKEKNDNLKLQIEYDLLSENLAEYEKMYQLQRMLNHENKNDLSTIRALAQKENNKDNKELISYIDGLIDIKMAKKDKWMDVLKRIPEHTLRGLLYYKFSTMQHKDIMIETDMSKQVTIKKFKNISYDLNKKVCKILGIYLDNAIQAVENLDDRHIKVSIYLDVCDPDILVISVMNNYKEFIEMDRLEEKGYSTKGKGRGLGLAIAKEILENEPKLDNQTKIIKNNFVQELKVML